MGGEIKTMSMESRDGAGALGEVVHWLAQHAGFPRCRLPAKAEVMICVTALARAEETEERERFALQRRKPGEAAALKTHALRRTQVHFKCDNSAKV